MSAGLKTAPSCSFCGKSQTQVKKLMADSNASVCICDECLDHCNEILEVEVPSWRWHRTGEPPEQPPTPRRWDQRTTGGPKAAPVKCSFCGKSRKQAKGIVEGPSGSGVSICDECVELCHVIYEEEEVSFWPWRATGAWWWHTKGEPPDEALITFDPNFRLMATFTPAGRLCATALSAAGLLRREMLDDLIDPKVALRFLRANNVDTSSLEHRLAENVCKWELQRAGLLRWDARERVDLDAAMSLLKANNVDTSSLKEYLADLQEGGEG
jgi:hypothetical protein